MKLRLVFTALGPLTLSLLFAAHSPPAHAADVTVVGTPGVDGAPGTDGGPGGNAIAITPANTDSSNTAIATGGTGGSGGAGANGGVGGNGYMAPVPAEPDMIDRAPTDPELPGDYIIGTRVAKDLDDISLAQFRRWVCLGLHAQAKPKAYSVTETSYAG
jgi:hypothetical protein